MKEDLIKKVLKDFERRWEKSQGASATDCVKAMTYNTVINMLSLALAEDEKTLELYFNEEP